MSIPKVEVERIIEGHLRDLNDRRALWSDYRNAYAGRFWRHHGFTLSRMNVPSSAVSGGKNDPLPVKVEVNLLRPHINRIIAQQSAQRVRMQAKAPVVREPKRGRPRSLPPLSGQMMSAITDDWMEDRNWTAVEQQLTRICAIYGSGALKLSVEPAREGIHEELTDRVVVDALPPWEALWDTYQVQGHRQRYKAHLRQQDAAWIANHLGDGVIEDVEPVGLIDYLERGFGEEREKHQDDAYFWVLEFYDLVSNTRRWFIGEGREREEGMNLREVLTEEMPYYECTIIPVVVEPLPDQATNGLSLVDGLYRKVAHRNVLLTVAANAFLKDAARKRGVRPDFLKDGAIDALNDPWDSRWVEIEPDEDGQMPGWEEIFYNIPTPPLPSSFRDFAAVLQVAQQEEQTSSPIQQGQQGSYLSATESSLLAQFGEQNTSVILAAILRARSKAAELFLMMLAAELEAAGKTGLVVDMNGKSVRVDRGILELPWRMTPAEASNSPARLAQMRAELASSVPGLMELAVTASGGPPAPPAQEGQPAPGPQIKPQVQLVAQRIFDFWASAMGLPEDLRWRNIESETSEMGDLVDEEQDTQAEVQALLEKMRVPAEGPDGQPDPFAVPDDVMPPLLPGVGGDGVAEA